ncbi:MAG: DEAD/DEAH box helicase [Ornithinimicrobium sp.]
MAISVKSARWVCAVNDQALMRCVGPGAFARGKQYADGGSVLTLVERADGQVLLATVRGSGRSSYQTIVERFDDTLDQPTFAGRCSCPMLDDCKHVAAVILVARRALAAATPRTRWEDVLTPLLNTAGPTESVPDAPGLALEVNVVRRYSMMGAGNDVGNTIELRPLREGKSKPWVRTGATWNEVGMGWGRTSARAAHQSLIGDILTLHRSTSHSYGYGAPQVHLCDLGPGAWPLLRRALLLGMPLIAGSGIEDVRLLDDAARFVLDVSKHADGALTVSPEVRVGDDALKGRSLVLGKPTHGVGVIDDLGCLHLAALTEVPAQALSALVAVGTRVDIPAVDADRFVNLYYPVLARQVTVGSSDDSVSLPEAIPPLLTLDVVYQQGHRTTLTWGFAYGVRPAADDQRPDESLGIRVGLDPAPGDPPRDVAAEQRLLSSLTELDAMPHIQHRSTSGAMHPYPNSLILGLDTATLAGQVLPQLATRDDVLLQIEGEPAEYVEAVDAPTVHLTTVDPEPGQDTSHDWFDLQVTVMIGDEEVPFAPLFAALNFGEEVMLLDSGTWFSLDRPELESLRTLIDEARELGDSQRDGDTVRVNRYQVSLWEELVALGVVREQSQRWTKAISGLLGLAELDPDPASAPVPEGLVATLRPYQHQGYAWLCALWDARLGAVLADDMGLGKTVQTLAMAVRAHERGDLTSPLLVVAPASVVGTWVEEAARFAPGLNVRAITATGTRRALSLADAAAGAQIVVTSYTLFRLEAADYQALTWSALVLDEAQFVKNHRSKTYQAARRLGAPFTVAITGTPLENSLMDLWSMLSLAAPGLFPKPEIFTERYRKPIEMASDKKQLATLRRRVRPFMLRRTKADVAPELPPKQEQVLHVELSPGHRRIYEQHLQRERQRVLGLLADMDQNRVAIFRALTALRQLALDPSLIDQQYAGKAASAKLDALVEQITEMAAEGHRALVFSSFTGYLRLVRDRLDAAGIGYVYLDGRTRNRPTRIASFREGTDPVFLISLKAGGFGLTLTEADYVFVLDPWWNPAAEAQAVDRTHRIGQTKSVMVYRMVSSNTIEDKVVALQERKRDLFARVVDDGEFSSGAITAEDIRGLLGA